ncbi:lipoprotein [Spiroplasma clarkii]|nr:lipoprotein [Spiroplasma clarkii]
MKKLLSALSALTLMTSTVTTVVACGNKKRIIQIIMTTKMKNH